MLKKLFLLILALNVVPFVYKGKALFVHTLYAQDWGDEGGDGGDDGGDDGDDPGDCGTIPPPTTEYSTYVSGNELFGRTCTTTSPDCNGDGGGTDCVDEDLGTLDCHGDLNGSAYMDDCNQCVGGNTGLTACVPCNEDDYEEAVQEYNDYIVMDAMSPVNIDGDQTNGSDGTGVPAPIIYSGPVVIGTGGFGSWDIRVSLLAKYYHYQYVTVNPVRYEDDYDLFYYQVSNAYFNGSNTFIVTTYATITPTTNDVYNNNTTDTYGFSNIVGTITHKSKFKVKLPYCDKIDLESHQDVNQTLTFHPR